MIQGIHHTSLTVSDMEPSIRFYRDILGMEILWDSSPAGIEFKGPVADRVTGCPGTEQRIVFMGVGGGLLELVQYKPKGKPLVNHLASDVGVCHVCFQIQDIHELYHRLSKNGVRTHCAPQEVGTARVIYFRDPDGIILEALEGQPPV